VLKVNDAVERDRVAKIRAFRAWRENEVTQKGLIALEDVARGQDNVMPAIVHAVRQEATLGEISGTLRRMFGRHEEVLVV